MQVKQINNNYGGIGFLGALCLLLVALKLTDVITWSWWAVTAPLWVPLLLLLVAAVVIFSWIMGKDIYKCRRIDT